MTAGTGRSHTALLVAAVLAGSALIFPSDAHAWGAGAHRMVSQLASQLLPNDVPQFLRTPEAGRQIAEVSRQPDWSKGAGEPHDADTEAANYVLVGDDLKIAGGPSLAALPPNRASYDAALRKVGSDQYRAGYLPYALIDGWQQVAIDLGYWRSDVAGARWAKAPAEQTWFLKDQYVREGMTIRDLGYLSHLIVEASQPMNVSVHNNGWGNYPNRQRFSNSKDLRARVEATVVRSRITDRDLVPHVAAYRDCRCAIQQRVSDYLTATEKEVVNLYMLEESGGFGRASDSDQRFVADRLAAATAELRDFIEDAWRRSADMSVGSPTISVRDVESGKVNAYESMRGVD
jgi:hypothetical protein